MWTTLGYISCKSPVGWMYPLHCLREPWTGGKQKLKIKTNKQRTFQRTILFFFSLWLNSFWIDVLFNVNFSSSVLLIHLSEPTGEDVKKSSLQFLSYQEIAMLLILVIWELFFHSLYLSRKPNNLFVLTGEKILLPCQHNYIGELGNNEWEQMKYLSINSLFPCAVIVTNKARVCGLWFRDRMRNQDIWVPFPALPQCIEGVIKPLCIPSVGSG